VRHTVHVLCPLQHSSLKVTCHWLGHTRSENLVVAGSRTPKTCVVKESSVMSLSFVMKNVLGFILMQWYKRTLEIGFYQQDHMFVL
jgi:hypothetical protein